MKRPSVLKEELPLTKALQELIGNELVAEIVGFLIGWRNNLFNECSVAA